MFDILAFRVYYRLRLAEKDDAWHERTLAAWRERWPEVPPTTLTSSTYTTVACTGRRPSKRSHSP